MDFICDTNVWYGIGCGRIDPKPLTGVGAKLHATPISLFEIAWALNDISFELRQKASRAVIQHAASVLPDPESWLRKIWGISEQPLDGSWLDGFKAMAQAASFSELQTGVEDFAARVVRRVNVKTAEMWRNLHYNDFEAKVCAALEPDLPGYTAARKAGKMLHMKKGQLEKFAAKIRSLEAQSALVFATWERAMLPDVAGDWSIHKDTLFRAIRLLAPYAAVAAEYYIECVGKSAPEPNDWGDLECFIYIRPDLKLLTAEKKWIRLATDAHIGEWVTDAKAF